MDRDASDQSFRKGQGMVEFFRDGVQDFDSRTGYFGADTVAGEEKDL
jgi:hypothetical protein